MESFTSDELAQAKRVDLVQVAEALGYTPKRLGRYYTLQEMDSLRIYDRSTWYRFSEHTGGTQIDFLRQFDNQTTPEAVKWLLDFMNIDRSKRVRPDTTKIEKKKEPLEFPPVDRKMDVVKRYLIEERGLTPELVEYYIQNGLIYQEAGTHNVVFLGRDEDRTIKQIFKRGTYLSDGSLSNFKAESRGSDKLHYVFTEHHESDEIMVFEAAIDLMSYTDLTGDFSHTKMALGMLSDSPLETYLERHPEIKKITFGLDNDEPGKKAAGLMAFKYRNKGYEISLLDFPEECKDFNDVLKRERSFEKKAGGNHMSVKKEKKEEPKTMKVGIKTYDVKENEHSLKGFADLIFEDRFIAKGVRIMDGKNGLFVSMPNYRTSKVDENGNYEYKDVFHPITKECRDSLNKGILDAFEHKEERTVEVPGEFTTKVNATAYEKNNLMGFASIVLGDSFVVNDVRIMSGQKGTFLAYPSKKTTEETADGKAVYRDLCFPITSDFQKELKQNIMDAYTQSKEKVNANLNQDFEQVQEEKDHPIPTR